MKKLSILTSFGLLAVGCNKPQVTRVNDIPQCNNQKETYDQYRKCDISDVNHYYSDIVGEVEKSDKVIFWLGGGPQLSLALPKLRQEELIRKRFPMFYKASEIFKKENIAFAYVNQIQWMKQKSFTSKTFYRDFQRQWGLKENEETIDHLHKLVLHFKGKGKKVIIGGESYGGFLINEYLAKYGDEAPHHLISSVGRLKMQNIKQMNETIEEGKVPYYTANDQFLKTINVVNTFPSKTTEEQKNFLKGNFLFSKSLGYVLLTTDFTKKIKDEDLSKVTFLTVEPDQHVGWFSKEERDWARDRGANVGFYPYGKTREYFNKFEQIYGVKYVSPQGGSIRSYAHQVGFWDKEQTYKYFVNPFKK